MDRHCKVDGLYGSRKNIPSLNDSPYSFIQSGCDANFHVDPRKISAHGEFFFMNGSVRLHAECWRPLGESHPSNLRVGDAIPPQLSAEVGAVIVIHGLSDYAGWNKNYAEFLLPAGFSVWSPTLRSHGLSDSDGGHIHSRDFGALLSDLHAFVNLVASSLPPSIPIFLIGRSFGSQLIVEILAASVSARQSPRFVASAVPFSGYLPTTESSIASSLYSPRSERPLAMSLYEVAAQDAVAPRNPVCSAGHVKRASNALGPDRDHAAAAARAAICPLRTIPGMEAFPAALPSTTLARIRGIILAGLPLRLGKAFMGMPLPVRCLLYAGAAIAPRLPIPAPTSNPLNTITHSAPSARQWRGDPTTHKVTRSLGLLGQQVRRNTRTDTALVIFPTVPPQVARQRALRAAGPALAAAVPAILFVAGEHDPIVQYSAVCDFARSVPSSDVGVLGYPDALHDPMQEAAPVCCHSRACVTSWLRLRAGAPPMAPYVTPAVSSRAVFISSNPPRCTPRPTPTHTK